MICPLDLLIQDVQPLQASTKQAVVKRCTCSNQCCGVQHHHWRGINHMSGWRSRGHWLCGTSSRAECAPSCLQQMHRPSAPSSTSSTVRHLLLPHTQAVQYDILPLLHTQAVQYDTRPVLCHVPAVGLASLSSLQYVLFCLQMHGLDTRHC